MNRGIWEGKLRSKEKRKRQGGVSQANQRGFTSTVETEYSQQSFFSQRLPHTKKKKEKKKNARSIGSTKKKSLAVCRITQVTLARVRERERGGEKKIDVVTPAPSFLFFPFFFLIPIGEHKNDRERRLQNNLQRQHFTKPGTRRKSGERERKGNEC